MTDFKKAAKELNETGKTIVDSIDANELISGLEVAGADMNNILIFGSSQSRWTVVRKDITKEAK